MTSRYICPVCNMPLFKGLTSYSCENRHSFDISSEGYINLAASKKSNTDFSGDAADTLRARRSFLQKDFYLPLAEKICEQLKNVSDYSKEPFIIDAGCGEGYYSRVIKNKYNNFDIYGIDLAKQGIKMAAKIQKNAQSQNNYCVAGVFDMPFGNDSADAVISVFAPVADKECLRVLKTNGLLIVACPGKNHLYGLKKALYDEPLQNEEKIPEYEGFELIDVSELTYKMHLDSASASELFAMTPYFWRSSKEVREKSFNLEDITTDADFLIKLYRKL